MAEDDSALVDRVAGGMRSMEGLEVTAPARPETVQTKSNADWLREQYNADPHMWRDYLQATARHPHLFQVKDSVAIAIHVEPVVQHFARDGLTREAYLKAVAADPQLIHQKPSAVIGNIEQVMDHYAADQAMRTDYLQAAVRQPELFQMTPDTAIATIKAAADKLEPQGIARPAAQVHNPVLYQPRLCGQAR